MLPRLTSALLAALASLSLIGCARVQSQSEAGAVMQQGEPSFKRGRVTDHVVVISIDGLRPDAIAKYNAPTMQRLMREGRYSLSAQTIAVSKTLPSHTSMLTGVDSDVHGITWNNDRVAEHGYVSVPTIFGLSREEGFRTAAFFSKGKMAHLEVPQTLDHVRSPKGRFDQIWPSSRTAEYVADYLEETVPNLLFVHLTEPDFAGHTFGWMGYMYGQAVLETDAALATLIAKLDERLGRGQYTVILTADHGGHGKSHGSDSPLHRTIPWIVWGEGVQRGDTLSGIQTMDTAATVAWLLGVATPEGWSGRAISAAFTPAAVSAR